MGYVCWPTLAIGYYVLTCRPWNNEMKRRYERFAQYFRADVHLQENFDWGNKATRDEMRAFVEAQIKQHGSFEAAVSSYEKATGKQAPPFLLDEPVLDYTFKRIGIPVPGPEEPNFLFDGTPWTTSKPQTPRMALERCRSHQRS